MIHDTILTLVGQTPLVRLNRINPHPSVVIAGKLEAMNPGGSIKDRVALAMIEAAERSGELNPDKTIIEATSGNTGIGLAMVCAVKGYRLKLLMPSSASEERKRIMKAYGAEIVLTPGHLATDGAIEESYRLAREEPEKYVLMDQYNNPASIDAHYRGTAREIWEQTEGKVTHVVSALGTSGTAMGMVKRLKEFSSSIQVVAVEPYAGHRIQGLKNMKESYPPGIYDKTSLDRILHVDDEQAFALCRRAAREEGLFLGMSAGAALAGAIMIGSELEEGVIVAILPDGGERYLSTPLFEPKTRQGLALFDLAAGSNIFLEAAGRPAGIFTFGPGPDRTGDMDAWRRIVLVDVLARYLLHKSAEARVCVPLADLEDHTLAQARQAGVDLEQFAASFMHEVRELAGRLNVSERMEFVQASRSGETMLSLCRTLLNQGNGYEKLRSVYYDVRRDSEYGSLTPMDLDKLSLGKTVDLDSYDKENPRDFTLLKRATLQDLKQGYFLKTEWGNVRPSWHLQMAAAAIETLGSVTVAFGGQAHWFPHLDNIRGLWAKAARKRPEAWGIIGPVETRDGERPPQVPEVDCPGVVLRMWLLSASYHRPLHFSEDNLAMWSRNWKRVQETAAALVLYQGEDTFTRNSEAEQAVFDLKQGFTSCMEDDLGLHHFWPVLFQFCRTMNRLLFGKQLSGEDASQALRELKAVDSVLGLVDWSRMPLPVMSWPGEIRKLVEQREAARTGKDFSTADAIRESLHQQGFAVEDTPEGPRLYPS